MQPLQPFEEGPRRALARAHHLMEMGEYLQASAIFDKLAHGANMRGIINRAPFLYFQAGRAHILMGDILSGKDRLYRGFNLLVENKRWLVLLRTGKRIINELENLGYHDLAQEFNQWLEKSLPENIDELDKTSRYHRESKPKLPEKCHYCGGTVSPTEVEWVDDVMVTCSYCGSTLHTIKD